MRYISTKELAERWGIDASRIGRLARSGRIPGAVLIGHSWMLPADARRPADSRRRESRMAAGRQPFRFPLYFYLRTIEDMPECLSGDERTLYEAERVFVNGEYADCCRLLTRMIEETDDTTVRVGALYIMCSAELRLHRFAQATGCFYRLQRILREDIPHKQVLILILHDLESYFTGNRFYLDDFDICFDAAYMPQMRDYYMLQSAFSDVMRACFKGIPANPLPYELFCSAEEGTLSPYTLALLRLYLALLYTCAENKERAIAQLQSACRIAAANRIENAIVFAFHYIPELFDAALKDTDPEQLARLRRLSGEATAVLNGLHESLEKHNVLHRLSAEDTKFVAFARRGMANKEIAALLGRSVNTIGKRYSVIFEKTGTHNKRELAQLYTEAMADY